MIDPLISPSEMDALLQSTGHDEPTRSVKPIDLIAREHRAFAVLAEIQTAADRLAEQVARLCARQFRCACEGTADPVEVLPVSQVLDLMGTPRFVYGLKTAQEVDAGLIAIDSLFANAYVVRQFGGSLEELPVSDGQPTSTERRSVQRLADQLVGTFDPILATVANAKLVVASDRLMLPPGSVSVLVVVRLTIGEHRTHISIALVTSAVGFRAAVVATKKSVEEEAKNLPFVKALPKVHLHLSATLGTAEISVRRFLSLKVGDLIVLGTPVESTVPVLIEGQPKFLGQPLLTRGNLSLKLTEAYKE